MTSAVATATSDDLITIDDLAVKRGEREICRVSGLCVSDGERLGIIGPNGSGKSTLLRVLAGLERKYTGQCQIAIEPRERVFVHQSPYLFRGTVLHNIAYGLAARRVPAAKRRDIALDCLERLGIPNFADRHVRDLSGGERRRVALARVCVLRPRLLLLDEPLADLDQTGVECVQRALTELSESTILIASPTPLPQDLVERTIDLSQDAV